jgi:hypothetical protein
MLNCVEISRAKKTAGLAVTYRAAGGDMFGTCPDSCTLKPAQTGTNKIDRKYERAVRRAVPRKGAAFLFTHFAPEQWAQENEPGKCVFNYSADSLEQAAKYIKKGVAAVAVVAAHYWNDKPSRKVIESNGVKLVRCPDETTGVGCNGCGGGEPLCARQDRAFGIVFTAHGAAKRAAGDPSQRGGCYAAGGNVALHWRALSRREQSEESDGARVERFAAGLRRGAILRHHIAGDIGRA